MSQKRKRSAEPLSSTPTGEIYRSEPIDDRTSRFIGYFSPNLPARTLQGIEEIKSASHKILAWRKEGRQRSLSGGIAQHDVGHDDDGEKYGGKKVEKVLEQLQVTGACVVARWYGGVMLGPVRFTHMEDCAKEAIQKWQESRAEAATKKQRLEEERVHSEKLAKTLTERDRSIEVLRTMAAAKEKKVKDVLVAGMDDLDNVGQPRSESTEVPAATGAAASPQKPALDYTTIPLDRLRALEKARDATLAFLLKRIEKAEADLTALGEAQEPA